MTARVRFTAPPATKTGKPCPACTGKGVLVAEHGASTNVLCCACNGSGSADVAARSILTEAVEDAVKLIRAGRPGRAEYRMVRAQLAAARVLAHHDEADDVAQLRWVKVRCRMNGPGHYHEAERLLMESGEARDADVASWQVAKAQVHATLALAAATIECASDLTPPQEFAGNGNYITQGGNAAEWRVVTSC